MQSRIERATECDSAPHTAMTCTNVPTMLPPQRVSPRRLSTPARTRRPTDDEGVPLPDPPLKLAEAEKATVLPAGPDWRFEPKLDGFRGAIHVPAGVLHSRNGADLTRRYPRLVEAAAELGEVVLDGEIVAYSPGGGLDYDALMWGPKRRRDAGITVVFVAFDLLAEQVRDARGRRRAVDLRDRPYDERRARLDELAAGHRGAVQLIPSTSDRARGEAWVSEQQAAVGIEGCLAKAGPGRYPKHGGRARWLKVKFWDDRDAVIIGVLGALNSPTALVLAVADDDGHLRTGLSATLSSRVLATLRGRLRPAGRLAVSAPAGLGEQISYLPVRPDVVVECRVDAARFAGGFRHRLPVQRVKPR